MTPGLRLLASLRSAIETINTGPGSRVFLRILAQIRVSKREFEETTCAKNANFFSEKSSMIVSIFLLVHASCFFLYTGALASRSPHFARQGTTIFTVYRLKIVKSAQTPSQGRMEEVKKGVGIGGFIAYGPRFKKTFQFNAEAETRLPVFIIFLVAKSISMQQAWLIFQKFLAPRSSKWLGARWFVTRVFYVFTGILGGNTQKF